MVFKVKETVFGGRHAEKLNIGDLVSWTEWVWDQTGFVDVDGGEPLSSRQTTSLGVISELYVEDREIRKVAMAKVVPMNTKTNKRIYERSLLVTSLKLISRGGINNVEEGYRGISE